MYAETRLEFRFMRDCSPDIQQFDNLFKFYKLSDEMAPELTVEEPMLAVDPLSLEISDQQLLDTAFHSCEQDLLVKSVMETPLSEVLHIKNVSLVAEVDNVMNTSSSLVVSDITVPKSVSTDNLSSMDMA
ncbi:hypothetical protein Bca52824_087998 [Brassica carinata]|uniref:Uncharacterized protein n=1 Tax=Brassica carinata TaxID=52824 RepID=A0A8X7TN98_BRACI|nr:hypothetical protein Bca52824_087998 [Brassica carinata]